MCVVENDVWSYPIGDGPEPRGDDPRRDDLPDPFEPVGATPWGELVLALGWGAGRPWDRKVGAGSRPCRRPGSGREVAEMGS